MKPTPAGSLSVRLAGHIVCLVSLCMSGLVVGEARPGDVIPVTTTIQAAIDAADEGDTISIPLTLYIETLTVDKSLTLAGERDEWGNRSTIWPPSPGNNRIITVQPGHDLILKDLILAWGFYGGPGDREGGAVYIQDGTLTIDNCLIYENEGYYGGAVRQSGTGQVIVQNGSQIHSNHAVLDGGAILADGRLTLTDFTLQNNRADRHGGGVSVAGDLFTASRGTFANNVAGQNGGGANINNSVFVDQVEFINNRAGTNGGGILQWNGNDGLSVDIQHSNFYSNAASLTGGALSIYQGATTTISRSQFTSNHVNSQTTDDPNGGAVYFSDTSWGHPITIEHSTFTSNTVACSECSWPTGGGLYAVTHAPGTVNLDQDTFTKNYGWRGGGVAADRAIITGCTFQGNTGGSGGGAYLTGASQIGESAFFQNSVINGGGALYVANSAASLSIADTRVIGNAGGHDLGGAMNLRALALSMRNVVVADTLVASGSAIELSSAGSVYELFHVTINDTHVQGGNTAGTFGIHIKSAQTVTIWNSIITNHGTGVQIESGGVCYLDHTLWFGNANNIGGLGSSSDSLPTTGNPLYAVDRYHLTAASPAIDHGVDRMVYYDIDGDARDSLPDIGADEFRAHIYLPLVIR